MNIPPSYTERAAIITANGKSGERRTDSRSVRVSKTRRSRHGTKSDEAAAPLRRCKDEIALIGDYLASRLRPRVLRAFETHLQDCSDCASFLHTYKRTIEMTRAFLRQAPSTGRPKIDIRPRRVRRHGA